MAVVVEDGTGLANADSYVSDADCTAYLTNFSVNGATNAYSSQASATVRDVYLRQATRKVDTRYGPRARGRRVNDTMALEWPRAGIVLGDGTRVVSTAVPFRVIAATCELALRAAEKDAANAHETSALQPDQVETGTVTGELERIKVDVVEIETETESTGGTTQEVFTVADDLMAPLLQPGGRPVFA